MSRFLDDDSAEQADPIEPAQYGDQSEAGDYDEPVSYDLAKVLG